MVFTMTVGTHLGPRLLGSSSRPLVRNNWCHVARTTAPWHFGSSPIRRNSGYVALMEATVSGTANLISGLHMATGMPWYLTIPFVALSVNLMARLPLSIYTQHIHQRRAKIMPLLQAWYVRHIKDVARTPGLAPEEFDKEVEKRFKKTSRRLYYVFGVQTRKNYLSFASFPYWLTGIEALRRLCGGPRGLLGSIIFGAKENEEGVATPDAATTAVSTSSNPPDAVSVTDVVQAENSTLAEVSSSFPPGSDPSLATGGCLWFPDLMAPDPFHVLPFLLSAILVLNVLPRTAAGRKALVNLQSTSDLTPAKLKETTVTAAQLKVGGRLQRALLGVALVVGPVTMDLPAALHLYWITSAALTYTQTELIARYMKIPKTKIRQCKGTESTVPWT